MVSQKKKRKDIRFHRIQFVNRINGGGHRQRYDFFNIHKNVRFGQQNKNHFWIQWLFWHRCKTKQWSFKSGIAEKLLWVIFTSEDEVKSIKLLISHCALIIFNNVTMLELYVRDLDMLKKRDVCVCIYLYLYFIYI